MRVLLLNDSSSPDGGAELQTVRTKEMLTQAGHHVRLFASTVGAPTGAETRDAECFGTTHPKVRVINQTANVSAARALRREMHNFRPDVVHIRMFLTQLSPLILNVLADVPTVWQVVYYKAICPRGTKVLPDGSPCTVRSGAVCLRNRCVTPQSWALDMLQQRMWRRWAHHIDAVITVSETMRRRLESEGVPVSAVIFNSVHSRPARPALADPPIVAYAGRLVPEKGVDLLIEAFARVVTQVPRARLLIAGTGPQRNALRCQVARLGLVEQVEFCGHLDRESLERRFDSAWVQAVPGRWEEPLGNVTLEAMMRGTVVVASRLGGPSEVVIEGSTGLLVPSGDAHALAAAVTGLLSDRARCEKLGRAGRTRALEHYAEESAVTRLEQVYRSILLTGAGDPQDGAR
ncbi:MAG: glycosyltransferase family 4 protein [Ornithinimicrobium sp.]